MPEPYQYGVRYASEGFYQPAEGKAVDVQPTKAIAEALARNWVISPLRGGPRKAQTVRRRGYDGEWETLDTWTTPEHMEITQ